MEETEEPNRKPLGAFGISIIVAIKAAILLFAPIEFVAEDHLIFVRGGALAIVVTAIVLGRLLWCADSRSKPVVIILFVLIAVELLIIGFVNHEETNQGMIAVGVCWLAFIGLIAWFNIDKQLRQSTGG